MTMLINYSDNYKSHVEAERALIGSILRNSQYLAESKIYVSADHFFLDLHRDIWNAFVELESSCDPIDYMTVSDRMKGDVAPTTLVELGQSAPVTQNMEHYSKLVLNNWGQRRARLIIDVARDLPDIDIGRLIDRLDLLQLELSATSELGVPWSEPSSKFVEAVKTGLQVEDIMEQPDFPMLNELSQVARGDLIVIGGQTSMGKTAFALRYCTSLIKSGFKGLYFLYEGSDLSLQRRIYAQTTGIKLDKLKRLDLSEAEKNKIYETHPIFEGQLEYFDKATTIDNLIDQVRIHKKKHQVDFICIDHMHLMPIEGNIRIGIMDLTKKLIQMGKDEGILVIALAQFKKEDGDKIAERPNGNSLRESATIKQDAHHIWLLHDPEYLEQKNKTVEVQEYDASSFVGQTRMSSAEIIVEKNREGTTGIIPAQFDRTTGIWSEIKH